MKFITLTKWSGGIEVAINTTMIVALEPFYYTANNLESKIGTTVHFMGFNSFSVEESIEEIQNRIKSSEGYAIINFDPKKAPKL